VLVAIEEHGYSVVPQQFSATAYKYVLGDPSAIVQAYGISILVTVVGTNSVIGDAVREAVVGLASAEVVPFDRVD